MKERKDVFKAMDALMEKETPQDLGITVKEFAERYNVTQEAARHKLARMAARGQLIAGKRRLTNGRVVGVYRFPED